MKTIGKPFHLNSEIQFFEGCTISTKESDSALHFSLAKNTSISQEASTDNRLLYIHTGKVKLVSREKELACLTASNVYYIPGGTLVGMLAEEDALYTEITISKEKTMNDILKPGEIFTLKDLVPYGDNQIVNRDLISSNTLKFVLMSFDAGTGLSEHAAPGDALIFALDGEGIIGYEGKEYRIHAGENFRFAKNGRHYVKADSRFKMALLLTLGE